MLDMRDTMRTTLDIDEELLARAQEVVPRGMTKTALIETALRALLEVRAADHLIEAAGSMPDFEPGRRRRT